MSESLTFEEFRQLLSNLLGVSEDSIVPEASFLGDLSVESLRMVEMLVQLEDRIGAKIPSAAAWQIQTVGDAYDYVRRVQVH